MPPRNSAAALRDALRARWPLITAFAVAGALAVPLHPLATPAAAVVTGLVGALGLRVWRWSRLPERLRPGAPSGAAGRFLQDARWAGLGLLVGLLVLGVIRVALEPALPSLGTRIAAAGTLPVWRRLLVIYTAAVGEELLFRLLLLSALAALAARLLRAPGLVPNAAACWTANALAALAFAAAHLPAWMAAGPAAPGLMVTVVALNAAGALVFGYLFTTRGLVAAIWAHAGADGALLLLGPLTG